jgi:hypothetical protein
MRLQQGKPREVSAQEQQQQNSQPKEPQPYFMVQPTAQNQEGQTVSGNKKIQELRENLGSYVRQYSLMKTNLSSEEIETELKKCPFISSINLNFAALEVPKVSVSNPRDFLSSVLSEKIESLSPESLNIISFNFSNISITSGAFYDSFRDAKTGKRYQCLFFNTEGESRSKEDEMETHLFEHAMGLEIAVSRIISGGEETGRIKDLRMLAQRGGKIADIPDNTIETYRDLLELEAKTFMEIASEQLINTKFSIPHEAFHYFVDNKLGKPEAGYSGPFIKDLFNVALKGFVARFYDKDSESFDSKIGYTNIGEYLRKLDLGGNDSDITAKLTEFCRKLGEDYDLDNFPISLTKSTAEGRDFYSFFTEYFARIYAGALGSTPEKVRTLMQESSAKIGTEIWIDNLDKAYHKPSKEELEILRSMKLNGKSILSDGIDK